MGHKGHLVICNTTFILSITYHFIFPVLVDKDNNPRWNPSKLTDVSDEKVDSYFKPLGPRDLVL